MKAPYILAILLILILVALSGCTPEVRYVSVPIDRPERPVLPRISDEELKCLDKPTFQKLYDRYRLVKEYAIKLETIIDSTHSDSDNEADKARLGEPEAEPKIEN